MVAPTFPVGSALANVGAIIDCPQSLPRTAPVEKAGVFFLTLEESYATINKSSPKNIHTESLGRRFRCS